MFGLSIDQNNERNEKWTYEKRSVRNDEKYEVVDGREGVERGKLGNGSDEKPNLKKKKMSFPYDPFFCLHVIQSLMMESNFYIIYIFCVWVGEGFLTSFFFISTCVMNVYAFVCFISS